MGGKCVEGQRIPSLEAKNGDRKTLRDLRLGGTGLYNGEGCLSAIK